jgi:NPCBM/NEW2 domain
MARITESASRRMARGFQPQMNADERGLRRVGLLSVTSVVAIRCALTALCLLPSALCSSCFAGTVRTLDGKTYDGVVSIDTRGYLLVDQTVGSIVKVMPDDVLDAQFYPAGGKVGALQQGFVLTDGSAIAGEAKSVDDTVLRYRRQGNDLSVPVSHVARIQFKPVTQKALDALPPGHTGVLLDDGDFFEGQFTQFRDNRVQLSSVLFGLRQFEISKRVVAVVLANIAPAKSDWIVRLTDGTIVLAESLSFDNGRLIAQDLSHQKFVATARDLIDYRMGDNRLVPLTDLKPDSVTPAGPAFMRIDATTAGVPMALSDGPISHGLGTSAGTSITYTLDGQYRTFICQGGVPAGLAPSAKVQFLVTGDGKDLFRSPPRTSVDKPLAIVLSVKGMRTLVLQIRSDASADLGAHGLWAEPALVKN